MALLTEGWVLRLAVYKHGPCDGRRRSGEDEMFQDLRYGARMLLKKPGFTLIAVFTLALGIGANTVIFSGVYTLLFQALPYRDGDRLVVISQTSKQGVETGASYPDFTAWKEQSTVFDQMTASRTVSVNLSDHNSPGSGPIEVVSGSYVSAELFSILDGRAAVGRVFSAEDSSSTSERPLVLSDRLWQRRFGGDPGVIGRRLRLNDSDFTVVGVMPPAFQYPFGSAFWTPMRGSESAETLADPSANVYQILAVLRPAVTREQASKEIAMLSRPSQQFAPANRAELIVQVTGLRETITGVARYRTPVLTLQLAVLFVLLIASANLANLLLARNTYRNQEFAIRLALGARPVRLMRQVLTESLLLGVLGSLLGLVLAWWGLNALRAVIPWRVAGVVEVEINATVLLVTILTSLLTSLAFGLIPAVVASRQDVNESLKAGAASTTFRRRRLSGTLVAAEVAMAVVLLTASGLMIRTFLNLTREDPGFEPNNALALTLTLPRSRQGDHGNIASFFHLAIERIRSVPGVETVGAVAYLPLIGYNPGTDFTIEGRAVTSTETNSRADLQPITPDYLQAMGISPVRGRGFTEADMSAAPETTIINQAMARKFWPDEDPLGQHIQLLGHDAPAGPLAIVGIIGDVKQFGLHTDPRPEIYLPTYRSSMTIIVRTGLSPAGLIAPIRETVERLDDRAAFNLRTMQQVVIDSIEKRRIFALLLGVLSAVALGMAALGIYGVISYMVSQRTHELGIRIALGAKPRDTLRLVMGQGIALAATGLAVGLVAGVALTRLMKSLLFGVGVADPLTHGSIALLLLSVALLACYFPARRAMKVDPIRALRHQ
jgi:putative ABC transport system permease protein